MRYLITIVAMLGGSYLHAQALPFPSTFADTRVISTHSTEMLPHRKLDFRVGHRFGDLAGAEGGWATFYGLENAADVAIGFDYGLTDRINIGLHRTKGA